jgi:hypothetical protein
VSGTAEALPCNVIDFIALLGGMAAVVGRCQRDGGNPTAVLFVTHEPLNLHSNIYLPGFTQI